MKIIDKTKGLGAIVAALAILFGAMNGIGTLVPSESDPFGGKYNRPCAAFRTNEVRKIALEQQSRLFRSTYEAVKEAFYD